MITIAAWMLISIPPGLSLSEDRPPQPLVRWDRPIVYMEKISWPVDRYAARDAVRVARVRTLNNRPRNLVVYATEDNDGHEYDGIVFVYDDGTSSFADSYVTNVIPSYARR